MITFLKYFTDTWIPKYEDNVNKYKEIDFKERTNNALENYHRILQDKLTKYFI